MVFNAREEVKTRTIKVKKHNLTSKVISLITNDVIDDIPVSDISDMNDTDLAYTILRHARDYLDKYVHDLNDPRSNDSKDRQFWRLQQLISKIAKHPPIKEFSIFLNELNNERGSLSAIGATDIDVFFRVRRVHANYLHNISLLADRVTSTTKALKKYLSVPSRFYVPPTDLIYNQDDFDTMDYERCSNLVDMVQTNLDTLITIPSKLIPYLTSSLFYDYGGYRNPEGLGAHILLPVIPTPIRDLWETRSPALAKRMLPRRLEEPTRIRHQDFEIYVSPVTEYFGDDYTDFIKLDLNASAIGTPFFEGIPHDEHGLHTDPKGKGKKDDSKPQGDKDDGSDGNKGRNDVPPGPSASGTTPEAPAVLDDSTYVPSVLLAIHAKEYTREVRSKPPGELYHDHMTRFNVQNETAVSLSESNVRRGEGHDFVIFTRSQKGNSKFVVTYTRMSRKPVFNQVA